MNSNAQQNEVSNAFGKFHDGEDEVMLGGNDGEEEAGFLEKA